MIQQARSTASSLLDLAVSISHSDAAHLYSIDPAAYELRLVSASSTSEDSRISRASLEFTPGTTHWLAGLQRPGVVSAGDERFSTFPETIACEVSSLLVCPLREEEKLVGVLTLSRKHVRKYAAEEIEVIAKLGDAALVAMKELEGRSEVESLREKLRSARRENTLLERRLAERKLVERAKGLLQVQYGWTEEEAYYYIRRTSRQQRTPMAVIAQRIIDVVAAKEGERELLSA